MKKKLEICGLDCLCCVQDGAHDVAYVLYPMDVLDQWIEKASRSHNVTIVVITGMDWDNVFSPWPAPGQPPGSPAFQGKSSEFLDLLREKVVPQVERQLDLPSESLVRSLVGVSMSGLFALWQWMLCDTFTNIASLSGSFWFPGFLEWMKSHPVPHKMGKGYFLLGRQEPKSNVKAFDSVGVNTQQIIQLLEDNGVNVEFESVGGNHFFEPIPRLNRAFNGLFSVGKI